MFTQSCKISKMLNSLFCQLHSVSETFVKKQKQNRFMDLVTEYILKNGS